MTEEIRNRLNCERLLKVDVSIRKKIKAVLTDLEGHGLKPLIAAEVWRDPALQLKLFKQGRSKLRWGFHCATRNGKPASLAADIVDAAKGWNASKEFWLKLAASARAHELQSGVYWGLPQSMRAAIEWAIIHREWKANIKIGWDPAHVQVSGLSVRDAMRGAR